MSNDYSDILNRSRYPKPTYDSSVLLRERRYQLDNDEKAQNQYLKQKIYEWVKWIVSLYLTYVAIILAILMFGGGQLSDHVIIALLTTTTINILGLPWLIIRSLFVSKK